MALKMGGIIDAIGKFRIMAGTKLQGIFTPNLVPYTSDLTGAGKFREVDGPENGRNN